MFRLLRYFFFIITFNILSNEVLERITYSCDVPLDSDEFNYLVGLKPGQAITQTNINNALYYLKLKNIFKDINITESNGESGKKLHFDLSAFATCKKVNLHGIAFAKNKYLQKYILSPGDVFDEQKHLHSLERITELLRLDGYLNAKIVPRLTYDNKSVTIDLEVNKGPCFVISGVEFSAPDKIIEAQIKKVYSKKFLKHHYIKKEISKKLKKLKLFLQEQNYPFAKVNLQEAIDYNNAQVRFKFEINLGQKIRLEFVGNKYFSAETLRNLILSLDYPLLELPLEALEHEIIKLYKKHGFYDTRVVIDRHDFIFNFLVSEGCKAVESPLPFDTSSATILRANGNSTPFVSFDSLTLAQDDREEKHTAPGVALAKPGSNHNGQDSETFGKIVLQGNSKIPFKKLIKEIDIQQGEIYKREKLQDTFKTLNKLQTFESINFNLSADPDENANKPVIIKLLSNDENEFKLKMGILQYCYDFNLPSLWSYKVGASFLGKNKFLEGDKLIFNSDFSRFYQRFTFMYKNPWFFDLPVKNSFQIYYNDYYQPLFYKVYRDTLYKINQQGVSAKFLNRDNKPYTFGFDIGFERQKITHLSERGARAIRFSDALVDKFVPYFFVEPTLTLTNIDDNVEPTKGYSIFLNLKMMQSFKYDNSFLRLRAEHAVYIPVFNSNVFAVRFRFGQIFIKNFELLLPSERLYLGGPTSLRSYQPDFSPPYGLLQEKNKKNCERLFNVPQGGTTMVNLNLELRMPVQSVKNLSFAIFNDLGVLSNCFSEDHNPILWGLGFGIRYQTPIGPFRFDIGFRNRDNNRDINNDSFFAWYLTLGEAF